MSDKKTKVTLEEWLMKENKRLKRKVGKLENRCRELEETLLLHSKVNFTRCSGEWARGCKKCGRETYGSGSYVCTTCQIYSLDLDSGSD